MFKIALLQYPILWADKQANLDATSERIAALAGKADVALLPEMFTTGFCTDHPELAEGMDGPTMHTLQHLADTHHIAIVASFICQPDPQNHRLVNRGFMVKPNEPIEYQDKRHLYAHGGEDQFFAPAQHRHTFQYQGVRLQLLICYDLRFPAWARNLSGNDYDILLVVANWPDIRIQYWDYLVAARAIENQCYIAATNCVGNDGMGLHYTGHSVAYNTLMQPIASFEDDEQGTKIATFDIERLHHFREVLPLWKDVDQFQII